MFHCQCALLATVSTNFVADCLFKKTSFIPFIRAPIVHSVCQYDHMSERLFTGLKNADSLLFSFSNVKNALSCAKRRL